MLVKDILAARTPRFSFEFFPPREESGWEALSVAVAELMPLKPAYVSVTYGAGGSTRDRTRRLLLRIGKETGLTVVSHLTCVGADRAEIGSVLEEYAACGVENILALRGDPPKGQQDFRQPENGFAFAADLVAFIKNSFPGMGVGVAGFPEGHPATPNRLLEMDHLKAKIDAGADYVVTQLFFDNRDFYDFRERCRLAGITVPIIAGIMPLTSLGGMVRMAELAAGSRIPAPLLRAVARARNDEQVERVGVHWAGEQVRDLLDNDVEGVHFYTLNQSRQVLEIYRNLGVADSIQLGG